MRILFVSPYYYPELKFGGPPKRLHALSKGLIGRGHSVRVLTVDSTLSTRRDLAVFDGVPVQYVPWIGGRLGQVPSQVRQVCNEVRNTEVVHCYGLYNLLCPLAAWISHRRGVPFVVEPMGMFVPRERSLRPKRVYNATLTKWMAKHAAAVVATSELEAEELKELAFGGHLIVRRNGIDLEDFDNLSGGDELRKRWQIEPAQALIAYFGRISSKKNLHGLVDAFVKADITNAKLILAGPVSEPDYKQRLLRQIGASSRSGDIRIEEPVYGEDLKAAWDAADLFVLPSFNENFGNAAGEAVAANIPVLVAETCGIASAIDQRAGLAVPPDVDSLAAGLRRLMDPADRSSLMAAAGQVKRELSWEEPVTRTERLYAEITRTHRKIQK